MHAHPRSAEALVRTALRTFRVVAIVGPRQAGKTTLAQLLGTGAPRRSYVTFDDLAALAAARADPQGFVRALPLPVTIDEVQRAPEVLLAIKRQVDEHAGRGAFLLTGSAEPEAVQRVRETLAGRIALVPLRPLTWAERLKRPEWNPLVALGRCRNARAVAAVFSRSPYPTTSLDREVLRGGFPEPALRLSARQRAAWFEQYTRTYLERDVALLMRTGNFATFLRLVHLAAAATGTALNIADLARDAAVSHDTANRWLAVMRATFLADTLPPYWRNVRKRLTKTPKLHFVDTGLAAHLLDLHSWPQAMKLNLAGALTESWVHHHLKAFAALAPGTPSLYFFRTANGEECDFVVAGERLVPLEVKMTETPTPRDVAGVRTFIELFASQAPFGLLLYPGPHVVPLGERIVALPMSAFLTGPGA
jgi:hypothetical protein